MLSWLPENKPGNPQFLKMVVKNQSGITKTLGTSLSTTLEMNLKSKSGTMKLVEITLLELVPLSLLLWLSTVVSMSGTQSSTKEKMLVDLELNQSGTPKTNTTTTDVLCLSYLVI